MNDGNDDGGLLMPEPAPEPKKTPRPAKVAPAAEPKAEAPRVTANEDLSAEIARSVPREPGDQVTCRRIAENHYRCNWWRAESLVGYDNPGMSGLLVTTSRISKSQFLRVTTAKQGEAATTGRLSITVVPER